MIPSHSAIHEKFPDLASGPQHAAVLAGMRGRFAVLKAAAR